MLPLCRKNTRPIGNKKLIGHQLSQRAILCAEEDGRIPSLSWNLSNIVWSIILIYFYSVLSSICLLQKQKWMHLRKDKQTVSLRILISMNRSIRRQKYKLSNYTLHDPKGLVQF